MIPIFSRRRFISIAAAGVGYSFIPFAQADIKKEPLTIWRGIAMGAVAELKIYHPDKSFAQRLVHHAVMELRRLEDIFSLYKPESQLVKLNQNGFLESPSRELVNLMNQSITCSNLVGGTFDPTVQPLWELYRDHFSAREADPSGPNAELLEKTLENVGIRHILADKNRITFAKKGVKLTLNGIAQGYITDKIVDLLKNAGIDNSLVDMGEIRALGKSPQGKAWIAGIKDPSKDEPSVSKVVELDNQALATSGAYGFTFDPLGQFSHIFDPIKGQATPHYKSVSVRMKEAAMADALSTAFSLMDDKRIAKALKTLGEGDAYLQKINGETITITA